MQLKRVVPVAGVVALVLATAAAAQNPQGRPRGQRGNRPAAQQGAQPGTPAPETQVLGTQAPTAGRPATGGGAARYLADNPRLLDLTPVQQARIRKLASHEDSVNAPLRAQMQQLTRGQQIRDMPPEERRRAAPEIRNVMGQMRANDEAELDSVSAILTPEQANRLETMREDFKARREARRAAMPQRVDSARARAGQRPPRP